MHKLWLGTYKLIHRAGGRLVTPGNPARSWLLRKVLTRAVLSAPYYTKVTLPSEGTYAPITFPRTPTRQSNWTAVEVKVGSKDPS